MTGYFVGGSCEGLERARQTQCCSQIIHLAKLFILLLVISVTFFNNIWSVRVHTEPGNPGKVVNLKQTFSGPGIA